MNVLLTNDDGIDAPGLAALAAACREAWPAAGRVIVVAPKEPHSGCGHRVTTDRPLVLAEVGPDRFHVDGTPADCVRLALATLFPESAPPLDWVLSGINAGGNLGVDIHHSGTVAAAREAALHGVKSLAVSHYHRREEPIDWQRAARWMTAILTSVVGRGGPGGEPLAAGEFWNVNFPHPLAAEAELPPIVECVIDPSPLPLGYTSEPEGWRYRSRYQERRRVPG
ncbi:MAG: 5'/3'-nucleotidase SurE, partial [Planctomycetota bacterium]